MVATHDATLVRLTKTLVAKHRRDRDTFEFQMLYGVRRDLQEQVVAEGYRLRVYVPYGTQWYPYFMRRLAERPANLYFFLSNLARR
jgi:proline dehydrogenase